jgi:hypothetical protein
MYAVMEEKLKSEKGKSLISEFEERRDGQSVYRELKKHALGSTASQLSGDTLLQYITTARYPGTRHGSSYNFVLHWKEQVVKYEKLELEEFPPKQKLCMLQNVLVRYLSWHMLNRLVIRIMLEVIRLSFMKRIWSYCCQHVPHLTRRPHCPKTETRCIRITSEGTNEQQQW